MFIYPPVVHVSTIPTEYEPYDITFLFFILTTPYVGPNPVTSENPHPWCKVKWDLHYPLQYAKGHPYDETRHYFY